MVTRQLRLSIYTKEDNYIVYASLLQVKGGIRAGFCDRAVVCARMHGLGCLKVEMAPTCDGNFLPHSHLSPNPNVIGRFVHSKLTSKKVGEPKGQAFLLITTAVQKARHNHVNASFVYLYGCTLVGLAV